MKFLILGLALFSFNIFADEITIDPGQSIDVGASTTVTCSAAEEERETDYVCYMKKYSCCEYAPYIVNLNTMERRAIGDFSVGKKNAMNVIKQYVAAGKCKHLN